MIDHTTSHRTTDGGSPTSIWLLRNPLDFIAEDHLRLRTICADMDRIADAETAGREEILALIEYLDKELPLTLADEDDDLLPRVVARAEPEDELPRLVKRLNDEHAGIGGHLGDVVSGLAELAPDQALPEALRDSMRRFAGATRRHLILENAVLLPLSRVRLTADDLDDMRHGMLKRRGLESLSEV